MSFIYLLFTSLLFIDYIPYFKFTLNFVEGVLETLNLSTRCDEPVVESMRF